MITTISHQIDYTDGLQPKMAYAGLYLHEESGLYLATYRGYNPATARWLNRDPIEEMGGLNLYGYVMNDPINFVDPDGRDPLNIPGLGTVSPSDLNGMVGNAQTVAQERQAVNAINQEFNQRFEQNAVAPDFQRQNDPFRSASAIAQEIAESGAEAAVDHVLRKQGATMARSALKGASALMDLRSALAVGLDVGDVILTTHQMLQCH